MFPKNRIDLLYRLLCLLCYVVVLLFVNNIVTTIILFLSFCVFILCEISYRNILLIVFTIIILSFCYLLGNYWLLRIMLIVDYGIYYLDTSYIIERKKAIIVDQKNYLRFNNKKKKEGSSNIIAAYLTVHLVLLFLAVMVG